MAKRRENACVMSGAATSEAHFEATLDSNYFSLPEIFDLVILSAAKDVFISPCV